MVGETTIETGSTRVNLIPRLILVAVIGLAVNAAATVVYAVLRFGPEYSTGISAILTSSSFAALCLLPVLTAFLSRKLAAEKDLTFLAFVAIIANVVEAIGVFFVLYLFERAGFWI